MNPVIPTVVAAAAGFHLLAPPAVSAQTCPDPGPVTSGLSLPLSAVRYLADDGLKGRLAGSGGERCAGDFIAREFARLGLKPGGENGTFFQSLDLASVLNPYAPGGTGLNVIATLEGSDPELKGEFYLKDVPVLHFFTNTHGDYHKPSDDWEKIDPKA